MENKCVKFSEFNPQVDNWSNYIERLNYCFIAHGIQSDEAKKANFFTVCGAAVFETLLALIIPRQSSEVTFLDICYVLGKHYSPKLNEISVSYKFYKRDQLQGESAAQYITELRKLCSNCNFVNLERMLRDRLVCGMSDSKLQYELLKRDNLCYQDVVDAMLSAESAVRDVRMIHATDQSGMAGAAPTSSAEPMDINAIQPQRFHKRLCYRCGDRHGGECRFVNATCHFCHKVGHLERICTLKKRRNKQQKEKSINFTEDTSRDDFDVNGIYNVSSSRVSPFEVELRLDGTPVRMQVDTGASFSLVNEETWLSICGSRSGILQHVPLTLRTWTATPVTLLGTATVRVEYNNMQRDMSIIVAKGPGPNLLGRDWMAPLQITLNVNFISPQSLLSLKDIIKKNDEIFKEGLGTYRGRPVTIQIKPGATPRFLKARPVPYAIKTRVEQEIDRLVGEGVLRPVAYSEWATPVVPILKKSGEIRLCGDYRSTVNQATESDTYPMPTANEIFAMIAGGKYFSTLDLNRAYTQVVVDDETAQLLTLNTCRGLYAVHRLAFGVKASPGIFQRLMTAMLAGIKGVAVLIDDIIISGQTMEEMLSRLDTVMERIARAGLRLNKLKCKFAKERVEFLGYVIDSSGIHPAPSKVESIVNTPEPKNVKELQAFLGLYNFYERFIPHKATILEPLHRLLDHSCKWRWTELEQNAFETAKRLLSFDATLVHYDLRKPVTLTCDSSEYGVGAVLSHIMEDGQERPIAMGSRTLHVHERRYSQLDKEAAAIMFGIQKFHNYLMGRHFTVITDHKPLLGIFDPKRPMPNMLSPRLTRIALALTSHSYDIKHMPGSQIGNADGLSRWPQPVVDQREPDLSDILLMAERPEDFPFDAYQIAIETKKDKTLLRVLHYVQRGWPGKVTDDELRPYWLQRLDLSLQEGCLLLGCRVVVPAALRDKTLHALHKTHSGIVQTKALARSYVWWPHMNNDIERLVSGCTKCLENRHMPPKSNHEWISPVRPWSRIHVDFAGPYENKTFLIAVDAYSRWPEVFIVRDMTSNTVKRHLRMMFATHGICETLVSDNGTPFVSNELNEFLTANNIKHITTAPYHPSTNGLAERMVQTVKDKLRKMSDVPWDVRLPDMLLGLRVTPGTSTNKSPAELLMNRQLRTVLNTIHPDNIQNKKMEDQIMSNSQRRHREANVGQKVMYRNFSRGPRWMPGLVVGKQGPSTYRVKTGDDMVVNRHIDQLVKTTEPENENIRGEVDRRDADIQEQEDHNAEETPELVVQIPSKEEWSQMLGIPSDAEITFAGGKVKNKTYLHSKTPYSRDSDITFLY